MVNINNFDNLPLDMKQAKRWLLRKGKKPYYVSGKPRSGKLDSTDDVSELATFEDALTALTQGHAYSGLGFALGYDADINQHWQGIDFDKLNQHPDLEKLVNELPGYVEGSPSGNGVHCIGHGDPFKTLSNSSGIEAYSGGRFFTVTGKMVKNEPLSCLKDFISSTLEPLHRSSSKAIAVHAPVQQVSLQEVALIKQALWRLNADDYKAWTDNGIRLKTLGNDGFDIWLEWSKKSAKFNQEDATQKWATFSPDHTGWEAILAEATDSGWKNALSVNKHCKYVADTANLLYALRHPEFFGVYSTYDSFKDSLHYRVGDNDNWLPVSDHSYIHLREQLIKAGFAEINPQLFREALQAVAKESTFDSAQQWLNGLQWDGVPRIDTFLTHYIKTNNSNDYQVACARYLWSALAGRVLSPGCQADMSLILIGNQGVGKSSAIKLMLPSVDYYCEIDLHKSDDDLARDMRGKLIGELSELRGLNTKASESIKAWLTRSTDSWTPKYCEFNTSYPRRTVFIGTTNDPQFLADPTGSRRFLPINVVSVDRDLIKQDYAQLWAEAAELYKLEGIVWQDAEVLAANVHQTYAIEDPWEASISAFIASKTGAISMNEVLTEALCLPVERSNQRDTRRAGGILGKLGFTKKQVRDNGSRSYQWVREF